MSQFNVSVAYRFVWTPALRALVNAKGYCPATIAKAVESIVNNAAANGERMLPKAGSKAANKPDVTVVIGSKGKVVVKVSGQKLDIGDRIPGDLARVIAFNDRLEEIRQDFTCPVVGPDKLPGWFGQWLSELPDDCRREPELGKSKKQEEEEAAALFANA